ncbi:M16 family metallopeptidase [Parachitinimonas caeni]|uniref:Pitrilysin family protein n=1 Tax=Parachitinimonas caeni TaxID=3031301 RepID=A0ABT7DW53_9NEIS|nr:pitrilysin family protein [Parachitinimonas caeni]MDK2124074.1 pitrilysin family protein [Parachitinimonas caeni]
MRSLIASTVMVLSLPAVAGEFKLPAYERYTLPNGLTVFLMEKHDVPLLSVRAVIKAGAVDDADRSGLAHLTQEGILLGSRQYPKQKLNEAFDFRGATLSGVSGFEQTMIAADMGRDDSAALLPLLADIVQKPTFALADFSKLRALTVDELKQQREQPDAVVKSYFNRMAFGSGAYGNPVEGTVASVSKLQRQDLAGFHQRYYRPESSALVVVGDFKADSMKSTLNSLFGGWRGVGTQPSRAELGQVQADRARVWLVNKSDSVQTTFMFGGAGVPYNHPDFVPLQVINTVLGGRFTSWLNDELRVSSGLTYGAGSNFSSNAKAGVFKVSSFTESAKTADALALAFKTYQRLWQPGIDATTLESAKAYIKGQFPPRYETGSQLASFLAEMFVYDIGAERINNFNRDVDSLTPERVQSLIKQHFAKDKLQMVLIGKASEIRKVAEQYGEVTDLEIKADGFGPK